MILADIQEYLKLIPAGRRERCQEPFPPRPRITNGFSSSIDYAESREWFLTPFSDRLAMPLAGLWVPCFYIEPLLTFDLDVIVLLPEEGGVLRDKGYTEEGECVLIEGVPVQFLPAYNALLEEALQNARTMSYESTSTKVLRAEHLVAICLQTGRAKDRERVRILREEADLDSVYLSEILRRHHLEGKWKEWIA